MHDFTDATITDIYGCVILGWTGIGTGASLCNRTIDDGEAAIGFQGRHILSIWFQAKVCTSLMW